MVSLTMSGMSQMVNSNVCCLFTADSKRSRVKSTAWDIVNTVGNL